MQFTEIVITNKLPSGTTFAATLTNNSQAVFVPSRVASACGLEVGQKVQALLVPNTLQPDKTPWMAARIEVALTSNVRLQDRVLEALASGMATAEELAEELDMPRGELEQVAEWMTSVGIIAATRFYALDKEDFRV
jgi:antitoxin component of MazEF toxin-antitoxin module